MLLPDMSMSKSFAPLTFNFTTQNKNAVKYETITFKDVIKKGLKVMDMTAFTLSEENKLPIIVFDMNTNGNLLKLISGENIGTIVDN